MLDDMMSGRKDSRRPLASRPDIGQSTVWRRRIRILQVPAASSVGQLAGIVEADDKLFCEKHVASREWVRQQCGPEHCPATPRWRDFQRLGRLLVAGLSKSQGPP